VLTDLKNVRVIDHRYLYFNAVFYCDFNIPSDND